MPYILRFHPHVCFRYDPQALASCLLLPEQGLSRHHNRWQCKLCLVGEGLAPESIPILPAQSSNTYVRVSSSHRHYESPLLEVCPLMLRMHHHCRGTSSCNCTPHPLVLLLGKLQVAMTGRQLSAQPSLTQPTLSRRCSAKPRQSSRMMARRAFLMHWSGL